MEQICTEEAMEDLIQWALQGLKRLLKNQEFLNSQSTEEIREYYTMMSNPLLAFVQHNLVEDPQAYEPLDRVYNHYVKWCRQNGFVAEGKSQFGAKLSGEISYNKQRKRLADSRVNCYVGIKLHPTGHSGHRSHIISLGKKSDKKLEEYTNHYDHPDQKTRESNPDEADLVKKAVAILKLNNGQTRQTLFWNHLDKAGHPNPAASNILRSQKHRDRFAFRGLNVRLLDYKHRTEPSVLSLSDKKQLIVASLNQRDPDGRWTTEDIQRLLKTRWGDLEQVLKLLMDEERIYRRLDK